MAAPKIRAAVSRLLASLLCLVPAGAAWAARPMATDDTSTAPAGECQIEAWGERVDDMRAQVLAPACGLTDTLELDTAASRTQGGSLAVDGLVLALKWVPGNTVYETALGTVRLGVEGGVFWARSATEGWRADAVAVLGLASLAFGEAWNLYANLGTTRGLSTGKYDNGVRVAIAWQPDERWLLFVEGLASHRSGTVRNAGLRLWAIPEVFGLDVVASRSGGASALSVGFGWYGIRWP
jgi:hypothetical protein